MGVTCTIYVRTLYNSAEMAQDVVLYSVRVCQHGDGPCSHLLERLSNCISRGSLRTESSDESITRAIQQQRCFKRATNSRAHRTLIIQQYPK